MAFVFSHDAFAIFTNRRACPGADARSIPHGPHTKMPPGPTERHCVKDNVFACAAPGRATKRASCRQRQFAS
ncbi:hypothetical protein CFB49_25510 [Burkholderia sp. AU17457]|nr:hypothetical protein CFB49_25510 [Burkholderia sp. AU17457]